MTSQRPKILCLDDEPFVLEALERILFEHFEVSAFSNPFDGLRALEKKDHGFTVVVSDMRMPEMDGAQFLAQARAIAPDVTRVLLTGQVDIDAAIAAVNRGNIFRFLCKPCPPDVLLSSLQAATEQHRLVIAEREPLEQTLTGSIRLLSEVLGIVSPTLFARTQRIKSYVLHMATRLELRERWRFELAALLSMVGCVGLSDQTLERAFQGRPLENEEKHVFEAHPTTAYKLLSSIPRFGEVAAIIKHQTPSADASAASADVQMGAALLRIARELDLLVGRGASLSDARGQLEKKLDDHGRALLLTLADFSVGNESSVQSLRVANLAPGMLLEEDVRTAAGVVVIPKGRELTRVILERLWNFSRAGTLLEPVRVRVPA